MQALYADFALNIIFGLNLSDFGPKSQTAQKPEGRDEKKNSFSISFH